MTPDELADLLSRIDACNAARDFCDGKTLRDAWFTCSEPFWLLWFVCRVGYDCYAHSVRWDFDARKLPRHQLAYFRRPELYERIETAARRAYAELLAS